MKLGVLTVSLFEMSLNDALAYLKPQGVQTVEIGCGGYPGEAHCKPEELLNDKAKMKEFKDTFKRYDMTISAFSSHGNGISPDKDFAAKSTYEFERACKMANECEVDTVVTFSGCPGGSAGDKTQNWVTCPWPPEFLKILDYQWNDVLIPYWAKQAEIAKKYGVTKIALEMHPGFCVYNPGTLLKLREAVGDSIGANFDPSHLIWQGIDPAKAIKEIGKAGAMFHFHAKDTKVEMYNKAVNGVLDTKPYSDELNRSWVFRSLGYGSSVDAWKDMVSALHVIGYDGALSIEHEDSFMSTKEGLEKAIALLKEVIIQTKPGEMFWA